MVKHRNSSRTVIISNVYSQKCRDIKIGFVFNIQYKAYSSVNDVCELVIIVRVILGQFFRRISFMKKHPEPYLILPVGKYGQRLG